MLRQFINNLVNRYGQGTLADKIGVDGSALSRFRSGQNGMSLVALEKLLEAGGAVIVSRAYIMRLKDAIDTLGDLWKEEKRQRFEELGLIEPEGS